MKRKFTVNTRLVKEVIPNHITTFSAFCELINNSIQANAKSIWIDIDYTKEENFSSHAVNQIIIKDDGIGVHSSELERETLEIATASKKEGKGVGRFCAFQIGKKFTIETVGFNQKDKTFSKSVVPFSIEQFAELSKLQEISIHTKEERLANTQHNTYYQVVIQDLYTPEETESRREKKKKLTYQFLKENIHDAVFEHYPSYIFNGDITFYINQKKISKEDFILGKPENKTIEYLDKKGQATSVLFSCYRIKKIDDIRVFLTVKNAGVQMVANSFKFDATWLSPKVGGWYVYVQSDVLTIDNYRNIDLDRLDLELDSFRSFIKECLNAFFKEKNKEFDDFTDQLKHDVHYPYREKKASSRSKELLFDKLAYLVEDKYHILNHQLREIVYPLIDRTISNGELENVLKEILKLDKKIVSKFHDLLSKSELEDVIEFSEKVASKKEDLAFLEKIVYSEVSKHVKERKQLHKYLEHMLWVFGEQYNESTRLLSDKSLENNLIQLRDQCMVYKASPKDDNESEINDRRIRSITDLFLYSEKIIDEDNREVLIVELKAPRVKISKKEIDQVEQYAQEIEEFAGISNRIKFKILLISSDINKRMQSKIKGIHKNTKSKNPYFYWENENENIEISVIRWSDLFENIKRKLNYLSAQLRVKDVNIEEKAKRDFADIELSKLRSTLKKVPLHPRGKK